MRALLDKSCVCFRLPKDWVVKIYDCSTGDCKYLSGSHQTWRSVFSGEELFEVGKYGEYFWKFDKWLAMEMPPFLTKCFAFRSSDLISWMHYPFTKQPNEELRTCSFILFGFAIHSFQFEGPKTTRANRKRRRKEDVGQHLTLRTEPESRRNESRRGRKYTSYVLQHSHNSFTAWELFWFVESPAPQHCVLYCGSSGRNSRWTRATSLLWGGMLG